MDSTIIVAIISAAGTMAGTYYGIRKSNSLVEYRLKKLEEKVDKHNHLVERMAVAEDSLKSAHHRIDDLHDEMEAIKP